ncbi:MAG: hypothetical protein M1830_006568 [Pleopsidium flavum]|nr:MAG: hypothetical protein M1830_006568 [Pleopsidium flavum]
MDPYFVVTPSSSLQSELTISEPQYRNNRPSRSNRTQIDHDVFEGLPVRHWRRQPAVVGAAPRTEPTMAANNSNNWGNMPWPELPMPRDSHLLPPHSQALLRAARSGNIFRPPPQPMEDEKEGLVGEDEEGGEGDGGGTERGFVAKKWTVVPRHLEGPEPEYLAKRRKGLPSTYMGPLGLGNMGHMRKVKVRKTDADGQTFVWEVLAPEGQVVEGEIFEDVEMTEAPAPGTVVEGVGVVNAEGVVVAGDMMMMQPTPPRRRPPPPRRKPKGPGRGRRKKVQFAAGRDGSNGLAMTGGSTNVTSITQGGVQSAEGIKTEATSTEDAVNGEGDSEMVDDSLLQDGDEEDEDNEEGDEGEEGDDEDREEGELSPSPDPDAPGSHSGSPSKPPQPPSLEVSAAQIPPIEDLSLAKSHIAAEPSLAPELPRDPSSSPELPLAARHSSLPPLDPVLPEGPQGVGMEASQDNEVRFSDGEVDLFGSLERHLAGKGKSKDE